MNICDFTTFHKKTDFSQIKSILVDQDIEVGQGAEHRTGKERFASVPGGCARTCHACTQNGLSNRIHGIVGPSSPELVPAALRRSPLRSVAVLAPAP